MEQELKRSGLDISRTTLANWIIRGSLVLCGVTGSSRLSCFFKTGLPRLSTP